MLQDSIVGSRIIGLFKFEGMKLNSQKYFKFWGGDFLVVETTFLLVVYDVASNLGRERS